MAGRREGQTTSQRECERKTEQKSNSEEREKKCAKGINSQMKRNSLDVITVKEKKRNHADLSDSGIKSSVSVQQPCDHDSIYTTPEKAEN